MIDSKTIAVVVPAYNEQKLIEHTLLAIPKCADKIIVVDDASTDNTNWFIRQAAEKDGRIEQITHSENRGVGASIATGYKLAKALHIDITVVMAGDGQMDPKDFQKIINPVLHGEADYSKGNRFVIPLWKYFGNVILSFLTRLLTGYKISDCQSGYTAINKDTLHKIDLDNIYPRYGMPNDFLFKLSKIRAKVKDVYTTPVYHIGEKTGIKLKEVVPKISLLFGRMVWQKISH